MDSAGKDAKTKKDYADLYKFTKEQENKLKSEDRQLFINCFQHYDTNGDTNMDAKEFKELMMDLGQVKRTGANPTKEVQELLDKYDQNKDGEIQWTEFIDMMVILKGQGVKIDNTGTQNTLHTISETECVAFSNTLNQIMKDNEIWKDSPIDSTKQEQLFFQFKNGQYMCDLLDTIDKESGILLKAVNRGQTNPYQERENLAMGISSAKSMGIKMIGVDWNNFNKLDTPHLVLGFVWQAIRIALTKSIDLQHCPEIFRLLQEGEELKDLMKLKPEEILIRWINYHLAEAGEERRVTNLGKDLNDSFALTHVLNQIDGTKCPLDPLKTDNLSKRAGEMITNSEAIGVPRVIEPQHIIANNIKVNTLYCSYIFNTKHGLKPLDEECNFDMADLLDDDIEGTLEERQFRIWINSLGIEGVDVTDLYDDVKTGILLCKVADKIVPGSVNWKMTRDPCKNIYDMQSNNGEFIRAAKDKTTGLNLKMIAIGGDNLAKGVKLDTLASVWQLCKTSYLKLIGDQSEKDIMAWANGLAAGKNLDGKGEVAAITSLNDKSLADGRFFMHILAEIEPRAVNWEIMMDSDTDEGKTNNAKYVISVARKLEALVFCVWDQITTVHKKQMFILFCTLAELHKNYVPPK